MVEPLACPNCRLVVALNPDQKVIKSPLTCVSCGRVFSPRFRCPDAHTASGHIFAAAEFYVDNLGGIYAFCPRHTFTTYALIADSQATFLDSLVRRFSSIAFQIALLVEGVRRRVAESGT